MFQTIAHALHHATSSFVPSRGIRVGTGLALWLALLGCTSEQASSSSSGANTGGGGSTVASSSIASSSIAGAGGNGGLGGGAAGGGMVGGASPAPPSAEDIGFSPLAAMPKGELIVFNDWSNPDKVKAMQADGSNPVTLFSVRRVWSMGISNDRSRIAFSCTDPKQEENFGTSFTDSIQQTWIYDVAKQTVSNLSAGNVNDECHIFSPDDASLYVCRRYDFAADGMFSGYRIASLNPASGTPTWLTSDEAQTFTLTPQPTPDGTSLWFSHILIQGGTQARSIRKMLLPSGQPEVVLSNASRPVFSPNGQRVLFSNSLDAGKLYIADLDGSNPTQISSVRGTSAKFSPDGQQVVYLRWDAAAVCSHIETVAINGSNKDTPTRLRDCAQSGESITQLAWID